MAEEKKNFFTVSFDEEEAKKLYRIQTVLLEYLDDRLSKLEKTKDDPNTMETNYRIKTNYYSAMRTILKRYTKKMEIAANESGIDLK